MTTIRDVARACGLSAMTVSAVLNNRPGAASVETRKRVLRTVNEMGYQPNAVARGLSRKRMNTLGVVMAYGGKLSLTADRYLGPVFDGILDAAKRHHQKILVITEDSWATAADNMGRYLDGHCDGLLFVIPFLSSEVLLAFQKRSTPFVLIGESRPEPELWSVDLDNVAAAEAATSHLIAHGHRRIGMLRGDTELLSSHQREEGYRQALQRHGISMDESLILSGVYSIDSGYLRTRAILKWPGSEQPTALFCGDDWIALGASQALTEAKVTVPNGMSLVGINDDPEAAMMNPPLTTIRQPLQEIGCRAVETVLAAIGSPASRGQQVLLPAELIERGSVSNQTSEVRK